MSNVFLNSDSRDIETAIMLEQAYQHDIGNAVAFTDGERVFINTDDNLFDILPAYDHNMLKWLLWHERYHRELRHHNRFFKYLDELNERKTKDKFNVSKEEVNIIMDILVHDSLSKLFPELVETAKKNLAQMRNHNSLGYTFKTFTLEEMLKEYAEYKYTPKDDKKKSEGEGKGEEEEKDKDSSEPSDSEGKGDEEEKDKDSSEPSDSEGKENGKQKATDRPKDKDEEKESQ